MSIFATAGTTLEIGSATITLTGAALTESSFSAQTWTSIGTTETLGSLGDVAAEITFDGIADGRTKSIKGTRNAGMMELVCGFVEADAGQIALRAAEATIFDYAFRLTMNNALAVKTATVTITIAAPGVVTWTAHGMPENTAIVLTTTGALPTGLVAGTTYYLRNVTTNTFELSATVGGASITTSGSQSGVQTGTSQPVGSRRLFAGKVMSAANQFDGANNVVKLNASLKVNSNVVQIVQRG